MSCFKELLLPDELPYEKFKKYGAEGLTDTELLAIILRTGTRNRTPIEISREVLKGKNGFSGLLALFHMSVKDLMMISGIGEVKAIQLNCIAEISKRLSVCKAKKGINFSNPQAIADYYMEITRHEEREIFRLILLDNRNNLISDSVLSLGTVNATLVSPRDVFMEALKQNASYIILMHNHPSGDPTPSRQDFNITNKIKEVSELMEIPLLDHIIIGDRQFISFKKQGLL